MKIYLGTDALPPFQHPVITIGTFDGVHQGHKAILHSVVAVAKEMKGTSILVTFEPHPRKLIFPNESLMLLSTLEERLSLIAHEGIDVTVVVPFTTDFAALSAQHYIEHFLLDIFKPEAIIIGYDHHFGNDRKGDIEMLKAYTATHHLKVQEIPAQLISEAAVSSTQIRKALEAGNVGRAATMLGTPYSITGSIIQGAQLGRTIGYPTANIAINSEDKLIPKIGVYAVEALIANKRHKGMMNIGVNPTVSDAKMLKIEVHLFDFEANIYDESICVYFIDRIRDEQKFTGIEALKEQLGIDKQAALALLS